MQLTDLCHGFNIIISGLFLPGFSNWSRLITHVQQEWARTRVCGGTGPQIKCRDSGEGVPGPIQAVRIASDNRSCWIGPPECTEQFLKVTKFAVARDQKSGVGILVWAFRARCEPSGSHLTIVRVGLTGVSFCDCVSPVEQKVSILNNWKSTDGSPHRFIAFWTRRASSLGARLIWCRSCQQDWSSCDHILMIQPVATTTATDRASVEVGKYIF